MNLTPDELRILRNKTTGSGRANVTKAERAMGQSIHEASRQIGEQFPWLRDIEPKSFTLGAHQWAQSRRPKRANIKPERKA